MTVDAAFQELSGIEVMEIDAGSLYSTFMTVAKWSFVTGISAAGAIAGGAAGTAVAPGVGTAAGAVLVGGLAGTAAEAVWDKCF